MIYQEAIDWLFAQLPMYQNQGKVAYKADLSNIKKLTKYLNNPQDKLKSIHVAGTNGKGSTSHMLASIFQESGYKVGLYTSPHLKDFRERIKINGKMASKNFVVDFVKKHKRFFEKNKLSFFEMTVGMAFQYFVEEKVDIAIIEVGLGGRLDSTNIITPEISVITNIGLDHTHILGNTLAKIAREKAGIIKKNIPCVIGSSLLEAKKVFKEIADLNKSPIYYAENEEYAYQTDLVGNYQKENLKTAVCATLILKDRGWDIEVANIKKGLLSVVKNTGLQGRWQTLHYKPLIVCDMAHNKEGLSWVIKQIANCKKEQLHIVFGVVEDKLLDDIFPILPKEAKYYFTKPNNRRALQEEELKNRASLYGLKGACYSSAKQAFELVKATANEEDMIYVGGSTFVVAEILQLF